MWRHNRDSKRDREDRTIVLNPKEPRLGYSSGVLSDAIEEATLDDVKLSLRFLNARQQDLVGTLGQKGGDMLLVALPREEQKHLVFTGIAIEKPKRFSDDYPQYELTRLGRQVSEICRLCQPLDDTAYRLERLEERLNERIDQLGQSPGRA